MEQPLFRTRSSHTRGRGHQHGGTGALDFSGAGALGNGNICRAADHSMGVAAGWWDAAVGEDVEPQDG